MGPFKFIQNPRSTILPLLEQPVPPEQLFFPRATAALICCAYMIILNNKLYPNFILLIPICKSAKDIQSSWLNAYFQNSPLIELPINWPFTCRAKVNTSLIEWWFWKIILFIEFVFIVFIRVSAPLRFWSPQKVSNLLFSQNSSAQPLRFLVTLYFWEVL